MREYVNISKYATIYETVFHAESATAITLWELIIKQMYQILFYLTYYSLKHI